MLWASSLFFLLYLMGKPYHENILGIHVCYDVLQRKSSCIHFFLTKWTRLICFATKNVMQFFFLIHWTRLILFASKMKLYILFLSCWTCLICFVKETKKFIFFLHISHALFILYRKEKLYIFSYPLNTFNLFCRFI